MRLNPLERVRRQRQPAPLKAHFLHIGKCGGSAVNKALWEGPQSPRYEIVYDGHDVDIGQVPVGEKFFFVLRDPLERYVSSFNDRQRRSRPRYDVAWSPGEERAYQRFETPDALGRALSSSDDTLRDAAQDAMRSIYHVRHSYWHWFIDEDHFASRLDDLLLVMWLPSLNASFQRLCKLLDIKGAQLPTDDVGAHRTPRQASTFLSEEAAENLRRWYSRDYELLHMCSRLRRAAPELRRGWRAPPARARDATGAVPTT